ncbi:MAG: dialkylresorcinol condensing enzyme DarA, partial [Chlorobi bacterium]|nr:dialkylresorcinol condensing enzyme DarA [Chlorobiota bacterium]
MKKILVIYYTQTGQLENIINAIFSDIIKDDNVKTDFVRIYPKKEYPFPWQPSETFYDVFPESVKEITTPLKEINIKNPEQYDLIVVGLQVWYLSPSIPANSFLNTDIVRKTIKNKPVITIYGTRNMWVSANKTIKKLITEAGGKTAGNIVLYDKHNNYISVMTIIRWLIKGQKQKSK